MGAVFGDRDQGTLEPFTFDVTPGLMCNMEEVVKMLPLTPEVQTRITMDLDYVVNQFTGEDPSYTTLYESLAALMAECNNEAMAEEYNKLIVNAYVGLMKLVNKY